MILYWRRWRLAGAGRAFRSREIRPRLRVNFPHAFTRRRRRRTSSTRTTRTSTRLASRPAAATAAGPGANQQSRPCPRRRRRRRRGLALARGRPPTRRAPAAARRSTRPWPPRSVQNRRRRRGGSSPCAPVRYQPVAPSRAGGCARAGRGVAAEGAPRLMARPSCINESIPRDENIVRVVCRRHLCGYTDVPDALADANRPRCASKTPTWL